MRNDDITPMLKTLKGTSDADSRKNCQQTQTSHSDGSFLSIEPCVSLYVTCLVLRVCVCVCVCCSQALSAGLMMKPNTIIHLQYLKAGEEGLGGVEEEERPLDGQGQTKKSDSRNVSKLI